MNVRKVKNPCAWSEDVGIGGDPPFMVLHIPEFVKEA
jgi:hypothetical protein